MSVIRHLAFTATAICGIVLPSVPMATPAASASPAGGPVFNGGTVMHNPTTYAVFWLPNSFHFEPPPSYTVNGTTYTSSDASFESLVTRYLTDVAADAANYGTFYNITTQYPDASGVPADATTFGGYTIDADPYPHAGTQADPLHDADVQSELQTVISRNNWPTTANDQYFVITGYNVAICADTANSGCDWDNWCAYHDGFVTGSGGNVVYSIISDQDVLNNCLAHDGTTGTIYTANHDPIADGVINQVSAQQFGMATDPWADGWLDDGGSEVPGECIWQFGSVTNGSNLTLNGHPYIVQEEWSAYDGGGSCVLHSSATSSVTAIVRGWNMLDVPLSTHADGTYSGFIADFDAEVGANAVEELETYATDALTPTCRATPPTAASRRTRVSSC